MEPWYDSLIKDVIPGPDSKGDPQLKDIKITIVRIDVGDNDWFHDEQQIDIYPFHA